MTYMTGQYKTEHGITYHRTITTEVAEDGNQEVEVTNWTKVSPNAKLTPELVREIRSDWSTRQYSIITLASKYGVSYSAMSNVVNGISWKGI